MTMKTEEVRARISPSRKKHVKVILDELGLNHSEAISMFYAQIELHEGIPFDVKLTHKPNKTTEKVLSDSKKGINVKSFKSKEALYKDLGL